MRKGAARADWKADKGVQRDVLWHLKPPKVVLDLSLI